MNIPNLSGSGLRPTSPVVAEDGIEHMVPPAPVDLKVALRHAFILVAAVLKKTT